MCYHLITYVEYACGHQYPTRRHYIDCNDLNCRLSSFHNQSAHNCENECEDIMLEDQRLVMDVMRERCSSCLNIATNGHGQFNGTNENGGVDVEIGAETDVE
ncbi:hypothetical protein B0H21DRAFT_793738 [Amylocystis lapponica]|nr:hypothetical protein B0H21DRAFT_793738 [Amylocystis lapponica]